MATRTLQFPETVREALGKRYRNQHHAWLADLSTWPLELTLGRPSEREAGRHSEDVRAWVSAWSSWEGAGELIWCERVWRTLGVQRVPERLLLHDPESVAVWIGEHMRWRQACSRYKHFVTRWPVVASRLPRYFDVLADYQTDDIQRLEDMLAWLAANPRSELYPRQLPIAGIDTKWLEERKALITDLLACLQGDNSARLDFYRRCGLREPPRTVRVRILDPALRDRLGGVGDISAPVEELETLNLAISRAFIVENLYTGLAFRELPGSVVFMGLGNGVDCLARLPWLTRTSLVYWGDLDTHGFAILNRTRMFLPNAASALMDEATLLSHRSLWTREKEQFPAMELPHLTEAEQDVYHGLKCQRWGVNVRLEQERIPWTVAWNLLQARR